MPGFTEQFKRQTAPDDPDLPTRIEQPLPDQRRELRDPRSESQVGGFTKQLRAGKGANVLLAPHSGMTLEQARQPAPGMVRVPGTGIDVPEEVGQVARLGLEAGGDLAGFALTRGLPVSGSVPRGIRYFNRLLQAGSAGLGAAAGSLAAESINPSGRPFRRATEVGGMSVASDLFFGAVASAALNKLQANLSSKVEPGARAALDRLERSGAQLTAGRVLKSPTIDTLETIAENSLFGRGTVRKPLDFAEAVTQTELESLAQDLTRGLSRNEVEELVLDGFNEGLDLFRSTGRQLYENVDQLVGDSRVGIESMLELRRSMRAEGRANKAGVQQVLRTFDEQLELATGRSIEELLSLPPEDLPSVAFTQAADLRSELLSFARSTEPILKDAEPDASRLADAVDDSIEASGNTLEGEQALQAFRVANEFWKNGRDVLRNRSIAALARVEPDAVLNSVIQPGKSNLVRKLRQTIFGGLGEAANVNTAERVIRAARAKLQDPNVSAQAKALARRQMRTAVEARQTWQTIQGQFLFDSLRRSSDVSGVANRELFADTAQQSARRIKKGLARFSEETIAELFPNKKVQKNYEELIRTLELSQGKAGRNVPGGVAVQLTQPGAAMQLVSAVLSFKLVGTTGPLLIMGGPYTFGKLVSNPKFVRWITIVGSEAANPALKLRAINQITQLAIQEGARARLPDGTFIQPQSESAVRVSRADLLREELRNLPEQGARRR